jgi:chromosome segregation protein
VYLKALTLKGFKSFADPATLQMEPGVTVVVGPNGSGKSNVVDAVAWVLGAQGPRTVRSSKMEDVIFAGSADRPPLGRAEVSLTIDNRTGKLPGGLAEITITRTLFRSGDSEYAINGQPCRLLDIQELLSDSGVGRQQHVIVSQGQLDGILNARPEDRRTVIEEAAGVLKHRRRRERSERRLAATEENLDRLGDLVREVRRQIRPLERQAAAARSHASLVEEVRALRLHLVGRDLAALDERRRSATAERDRLAADEAVLQKSLGELDAAMDLAAAEMSARREEDLVVALTRVQSLGERCRGLTGMLVERRRSLAQALEAAAGADVVSSLESDAARLVGGLEAVGIEEDALEPHRVEVEQAEAQLAEAVAAYEDAYADAVGWREVEEAYAVARSELEPLTGSAAHDREALARLEQRIAAIEARRTAATDELANIERQIAELDREEPALERRALDAAATAEAAAQGASAAEATHRTAEGERHRAEARAEALARAVEQARGAAGAQVLAGASGMVGTLEDLVEVDEGWHAAFEAAVGASLSAVVVEGADTARAALARLREHEASGTVFAIGRGVRDDDAGVVRADPPSAAVWLRTHVRPKVPALAPLLERLVGNAVAVRGGWRDAVDVALERPDLVVVTRDGDRFSAHGWVVRGGDQAPATAAAADEARAQAAAAGRRADESAATFERARAAADAARRVAAATARDYDRAADRRPSVEAARSRVRSALEVLADETTEARRHGDEARVRLEQTEGRLADLRDRLPELEAASATAAGRLSEATAARGHLEERRSQVAGLRRGLEVRAAAFAERRAVLTDRLQDVERRLAGHVEEREQATERRRRIESDARSVERLATVVQRHGDRLAGLLERLQDMRTRQLDEVRAGGERLEALRRNRSDTAGRANETRDRLQRLEVELAEAGVRHESAVEALRRELGVEPAEAMGAPCPELPDGVDAPTRLATVETELAGLGPVNPLALEELGALEERYRFLEEQVEDVRRARRELQQVIRAVDDEIVRLFAEAFADVNEHFQTLVAALFPGGTGRLALTDTADLLNTGVEVEARPAGKNVRKLSLLSGGERSLVALAFLFAVFRSRPSPFYLMDEVEAALDDVNLHRFLDLLHEFRDEAQLIIVSHQKRTMEAADALYGVTMAPGGSSKVVSQKVRRDPEGGADFASTAGP